MRMTPEELAAKNARNKAAWNRAGVTHAEVAKVTKGKVGSFVAVHKQSKYRNTKTEVDGILFDSKREAGRYLELKALEAAGAIHFLRRQIRVPLVVAETLVAHWIADFEYIEGDVKTGTLIWEDVKSAYTRKLPVFRLKAKLVKAIYGREIRET